MVAIISLLIVLTLSILFTRIATVALSRTGLSAEAARFQARSAFTGVGFTTTESEKVVNHPVRRRVLMILMLLGNAGVVTAISSLILTFMDLDGSAEPVGVKLAVLITGLVILWAVATSKWVDLHISRIIRWALDRYTRLEVQDVMSLLHLAGGCRVSQINVHEGDWMADRKLSELGLPAEGILVLGITRKTGKYLTAPDGSTEILPNDHLILYGRSSAIDKLQTRKRDARGDRDHAEAVAEQETVVQREKAADTEQQRQEGTAAEH